MTTQTNYPAIQEFVAKYGAEGHDALAELLVSLPDLRQDDHTDSPLNTDELVAKHGQFVSVPKGAELLCISPRTFKRMIDAGDVKLYRVGSSGTFRVKTADVAALMREVEAS